ncbi:MAG: precorrin-2 C(20)-methyltransferase [Thermodesulfobacteriota bacterium]
MEKKRGTLYGVGVGPGDPRLLTLWAVEVLGRVPVVFAAGSTRNDYSLALDIVRDRLPPETEVRPLDFPMTRDRRVLEEAWAENASQVLEVLEGGRDAAFITLGDPLTYSTFGPLLKTIQLLAPEIEVVTVPGVTAYHAAAARLNQPLAQGDESLIVVTGLKNGQDLKTLAGGAENVVILKAYRNFDRLCEALDQAGLAEKAVLVSCCGREDERIERRVDRLRGQIPPYLSLLLIKSNGVE